MTEELLKRLDGLENGYVSERPWVAVESAAEAAALIRQLKADNERMREAVEPFAKAAENMNGDEPDDLTIWESPEAMSLQFGDLRRAAKSLNQTERGSL